MYYFIDWIKSEAEEGFEPSLPEGVDFALVAENKNKNERWGVFECDFEDYNQFKDKIVSELLISLLYSAVKFPPVMAYSRYEIEEKSKNTTFTKNEFDFEFCKIIKKNIHNCKQQDFVFAKASANETGYLAENEYFWVVSAKKDNWGKIVVSWVSDDYFFYRNPAKDFDLSELELNKLIKNITSALI